MLLPLSYPAFFASACCIVGTFVNQLRSISVPDNTLSVAVLLFYSGVLIRQGNNNLEDSSSGNGVAGALAASLVLFLLSLPRAHKGPVPLALFAGTAAFYAIALSQIPESASGDSEDPITGFLGSLPLTLPI